MKNELVDRLRSTWAGLAPAEQRLVMIGAIFLGIVLLYMLLWRPVQKDLTRLRTSVPEQYKQLQHMRVQAASIKPLRARVGSAPAPGMLLSVVDQSATARGLRGYISRLEADSGSGLQLVAEAMPFNTFIAWLAELQDGYALVVENATIDAHSVSGTVNVKMKLRVEAP